MKTETIYHAADTVKPEMVVFRNHSRGQADYGWLKTRYSFSFANYVDRDRIHFGALRVLNDDVISGGMGFDLHPHDNMEIITIPLSGTLKHTDSMGHSQLIEPDEVQVMSAGTGLFHAEFNASKSEPVELFQIWIIPETRNVEPVYKQAKFNRADAQGQWQRLVEPIGSEKSLTIHQQSYISRVYMLKGEHIIYQFNEASYGSFLMVVEGSVETGDITLQHRDAAGILNGGKFEIVALSDTCLINIEVPDLPRS